MSRGERRKQLADATILVVARHGVRGASTARIAREAGVSEGTLYRHFHSRSEIILAAVDAWYDSLAVFAETSRDGNAVQWLVNIMHAHLAHFGGHDPDLSRVFLEFAAAAPGDGVSDHMYRRQAEMNERLADIIRRGMSQGAIRSDIDPSQAAWHLVVILWADQLARAMNPDYAADSQRTTQLYEQVVQSIIAAADPSDPR